jgi:DNA-binding GntR family transcriptional regulator
LPPDPLAEQLYRRLREDLLLGVVPPGTHLTEEWAAAAYEASRTPVREAYRRLALEGLLVHRPRRGYLAPEITVAELDELYEMRLVLEAMSARRAAEVGDEDQLSDLAARWDMLHDLRPNADVLFLDEAFHGREFLPKPSAASTHVFAWSACVTFSTRTASGPP